MIDAKDLRINNWAIVYAAGKETSEPRPINISDILMSIDHPEWFIPLDLTDDWLRNFGFKEDLNEWKQSDFSISKYGINKFKFVSKDYEIEVAYVHKLQNLFYELTGKDLIPPQTGARMKSSKER